MIEEIQALLPLLEKVSDGALYAFVSYLCVKALSFLVWPVALAYVAVRAVPKVISSFQDIQSLDIYRLEFRGKDLSWSYFGGVPKLGELFSAIAPHDDSYIHSSDIDDAIKKLAAK